jgi:hypothetical protein
LPVATVVALLQPVAGSAKAPPPAGPVVGANNLVDLDHGLQFPQNKQNEPAITRDPLTGVLVAGANDERDNPLCHDVTTPLTSPCPFVSTPESPEQISGFYVSRNNGASWTGGYLTGYDNQGIRRASGGDPSLDYGPARCSDKTFAYSCGVTIYYANLADPINPDQHFSEAVAVSRTHNDGSTWELPSVVNALDKTSDFDDHEWIAVDKVAGSLHFGRVYLFIAIYCGECSGTGNVKLMVVHSDDEAVTWSAPVQVSAANNNKAQGFRETGQMAVAADGTVEVFWTENADSPKLPSLQVVATSKDGGNTFTSPITIARVTDYPLRGTPFDAVDLFNRVPGMSARVDCYPHPAADTSIDPLTNKPRSRVFVVWCDFGGGHGVVKGAVSSDGLSWTPLGTLGTIAQISGRNAFFPQVSVDPSGIVNVAFDALTAPPPDNPWQTGIQVYDNYFVQSTNGSTFSSPLRVSTASSNPDGSSYNNLQEQFIGDYIGIVSGLGAAYIVWTDTRNAAPCDLVNAYRNAVYAGSKTAVAPNPDRVCATNFGNTDTYEATVSY